MRIRLINRYFSSFVGKGKRGNNQIIEEPLSKIKLRNESSLVYLFLRERKKISIEEKFSLSWQNFCIRVGRESSFQSIQTSFEKN